MNDTIGDSVFVAAEHRPGSTAVSTNIDPDALDTTGGFGNEPDPNPPPPRRRPRPETIGQQRFRAEAHRPDGTPLTKTSRTQRKTVSKRRNKTAKASRRVNH